MAEVLYPGALCERLYTTETYMVHHIQGDESIPFPTFSSPDGTVSGSSLNDAISISDKQFRSASFTNVRMVPAYTDGGKGFTSPGAKCFIWDEPYNYWCVSDFRRPNNLYRIEGTPHQFAAATSSTLPVDAGEDVLFLQGRAVINGAGSQFPFQIWENPGAVTFQIDAVEDSFFLKVVSIPV